MRKIFFDHFPKTGGTSLVKNIEKIIGSTECFHSNTTDVFTALYTSTDVFMLHGHFHFNSINVIPIDRYCMTMLRDPVDRVLSSYYFARNNCSINLGGSVKYAHLMELEEYIEVQYPELINEVSNSQTKHFYPLCWRGAGVPNEQEMLSCAMQALEQFQLVGVLDQYRDFLDVLCFEQGWLAVTDIVNENITKGRQKVSGLSAQVLRRLEELNKLDIELYQYACKLFKAHQRRIMLACIEQRSLGHQGIIASHASTAKPESLSSTQSSKKIEFGDHGAEIVSATVQGDLLGSTQILSGEMFVCKVIFKANEDIPDLTVGIHIYNEHGLLVYGINSRLLGNKFSVSNGAEYFTEFIARCDLGIGNYTMGVAIHPGSSHLQRCFHWREQVTSFEIIGYLGYHFVGAVKLYPQLKYGCLDPLNAAILSETPLEEIADFNILAHHTPALMDFSFAIKCLAAQPLQVFAYDIFEIEIEVCNSSQNKWPSIGLRQVNVCYHWLDSASNLLVYDGKRTPLPCDVEPGKTVRLWASVIAPAQPGEARLQITLVQEHVGWFDEHGSLPAEVKVLVSA